MEIQITQEQVDAVIESIVRKELDNLEVYSDYYERYRKKALGEYLEDKVNSIVEEYLKEKLDAIVDTEVAEAARMEAVAAFLAKPVKITNGYQQSEYDSWSSYLLKSIHEKSLSSWNVNKEIRETIDRLVKHLWDECEEQARTAALASFDSQIKQVFNVGKQQ